MKLSQPEWIDATMAAGLIGDVDARAVKRLAAAGRISVRELPGVRARFLRSDIERLATETVRQADPNLKG